jgi:hypothetical protein
MASLLEILLPKFGERLLMDLCLVAPAESFDAMAGAAEIAFDGINKVQVSTLEPLLAVPLPSDNFAVEAWQRGVRAAKQTRNRFGIKDTDAAGATQVFERLRVDTARHGDNTAMEGSLPGAVARNDGEARIALLQPVPVQRRFAAARAIFTAWTAGLQESRFLTSAVTRDQQASRAFAAELAAELQIGSDVVSKQALNNGLQVTPI